MNNMQGQIEKNYSLASEIAEQNNRLICFLRDVCNDKIPIENGFNKYSSFSLIKEDLEAEESHLKPALAAKFAEMKGSASPQLGAVHETLEERRAILAQQDAAYQASLAADEEKERLRAERALAVEPPMSHEEIKRRVAEAAEKRRKQNEGAGPAD